MEYLLYLFKLGSRKATGKQPANELKHSPSAGLCLQKKKQNSNNNSDFEYH